MGCGNVENALGAEAKRFTGAGVYVLQVHLRRGWLVGQHVHKYAHLAVIPVEGRAVLQVDGEAPRTLVGPCAVVIEAGKRHSVRALTDVLWQCVHRIGENETDPLKIEEGLVK